MLSNQASSAFIRANQLYRQASSSTKPRAPDEQLRRRSLLQSYKVLSPNTRLALSFGLLAFAYLGLKLSDKLQDEYPDEQHMPSLRTAGATTAMTGTAPSLTASKTAEEKSERLI